MFNPLALGSRKKELAMKSFLFVSTILMSMTLLSSCAQTAGSKSMPTLSGHTRPTEALPAPDQFQQNSAINSSTMKVPTPGQ